MTRRIALVLALALALVAPAGIARATTTDKATVLAGWTQPTAASTAKWNAARLDREPWASYGFDWSTDYCSASPERPLGFDFANACWHHDFGYRNYKDLGRFAANKTRLDDTFYADMKRVCVRYSVLVRAACYSVAWTYYQAVRIFGSVSFVRQADLDRAERLMRTR
ncbi:phospholipase [Paractinoplanes lichenicola]|uniref:Phospholipase n=1 Tax=Paractinoplanes lichenicola TaxID=2802976 RepID=A0ABS1VJL0_9ACTN|nr:phospholipase [Actinoplanes lichenicola]MBL7254691.1 phospholipase [Actinoplanes lichenicola]